MIVIFLVLQLLIKSSLAIKINQSNHDEPLISVPHTLSNPPPSSINPPISSPLENNFRRNSSSTIVSMNSFSRSKSSVIGNFVTAIISEDTTRTKHPRKRQLKHMGSAPTLNIPFMSMTKNLNKFLRQFAWI
ncbi:8754_t:CDS:1 [Dentiscutata erythropus]|uniref:8754_t:CDS:1 n=1 Tax=Dentiscutata erythropus TaxID=1348616 RepID=A0A9N9IE00_9GLOM|nr:8754_t:CDS:1 [Dentiscutata erythropus]